MLATPDSIPAELKQFNQWVCWRSVPSGNGKPRKLPICARNGNSASVTDPATWATFDEALKFAQSNNVDGVGFVLTNSDPFTIIDLDRNGKQSQTDLDIQTAIYNSLQSYAELSPSGLGCHIICKGNLPSAVKRGFLEMYSNERYFTVTGLTARSLPIQPQQSALTSLWEQYAVRTGAISDVVDSPEKYTDSVIMEIAKSAGNGEKFTDLYYGNWQKYNHPSASEGDLALVNMIWFYSRNIEQTKRIFRSSGLAMRDINKAMRDDNVNRLIKLAADQDLPLIDFSQLQVTPVIKGVIQPKRRAIFNDDEITAESAYTCPPGLMGMIAQFIHSSSVRPVKEISLAASIACMAGICGRQYNVSKTGLNHYILLLAPTGSGKEGMATGIEKLFNSIRIQIPHSQNYLGPGELASGQALVKYVATIHPCFLSIIGEFGIRLQSISNPKAIGADIMLRKVLLDLFSKSGAEQVLRPTAYSESDRNIPSVESPAFSLLGESTPDRYYQAIDDAMIAEGLLPRFTLIEYEGDRPPFNEDHDTIKPSEELKNQLMTLVTGVVQLQSQNTVVNIATDQFAKTRLTMLNAEFDSRINDSDSSLYRHLWNRAHLKIMKLAGLVAVGINPYQPTITIDLIEWADRIVRRDIFTLIKRFQTGVAGNKGNFETEQFTIMLAELRRYIRTEHEMLGKYGATFAMHKSRVIPYVYLSKKLSYVRAFREDRNGATGALKRVIATMLDMGNLQLVSDKQALSDFNSRAKLYFITGESLDD